MFANWTNQQKLIGGFAALLLFCTTLACGVAGFVENTSPLAGRVYWAAETSTPIPTQTIFLGTTTPVYPDTPVPALITELPALITEVPIWTTVTATPIFPPPTATPFGFVATPYWVTTTPNWVTTTPVYITETPVPPWTTTPSLPMIGFTTPEPLETPYYRIGSFYMHQDVYVDGPNGIVFRLIDYDSEPSPNDVGASYHYFTIRVKNHTGVDDVIVPMTDVFFIRRILNNGIIIAEGRWVNQNEPLLHRGLPLLDNEDEDLDDLTLDDLEEKEFVLGFVTPDGEVESLGLVTDWGRQIEGGLPVWFLLARDPLDDPPDSLASAFQPPPPTPSVLDDYGGYNGGSGSGGGPGNGVWPTTGSITRGFACSAFYTGVNGAGFGCPPTEPWFHNGVDIANAQGTGIYSPIDGNMEYAGPNPTGGDCSTLPGSQPPHEGLGNYQRITDGNTLHYLGHLSAFVVTSGFVSVGQTVSEMGSTGCSTGSHLHWMVYEGGSLVDPAIWAGPGP